jgi:pyrimidine-nucleoside phosphorylase
MIAAHGGDARVVDDVSRLPRARYQVPVLAPRSGYVTRMDALALGQLGVAMGAGRTRADERIDPRVGMASLVRRGAFVEAGQPLLVLHLSSSSGGPQFRAAALQAFELSAKRPRARRRVLEQH